MSTPTPDELREYRMGTIRAHEPDTVAEEQLEELREALAEAADWFTRQNPAHKYRECRHCNGAWWPGKRHNHHRGCPVPKWSRLTRRTPHTPTDSPNSESPAVPERMEEE